MLPKLFSAGSFFLPTYGLLVTLGFLAGFLLTTRLARRAGRNTELIGNLAVYCVLAGMLGSKLMLFALDWENYAQRPGRLFTIDTLLSMGVFHGGLIAALIFAWFYMRRQNLPWLATADLFSPGLALGHAIGRLGCFAAGCCWGSECDRPWAVTFTSPDANILVGVPLGVKLHPAQLYETFGVGVLAWLLYRAWQRPHADGRIFGWYLAGSGAIRLVVEFFRYHEQAPPAGGPLTWTQWIAIGMLVAGAAMLAVRSSAQSAAQTPKT